VLGTGQDREFAVAEAREGALALRLRDVAVDHLENMIDILEEKNVKKMDV